ncbi:MAG TPA: AMP-binding protein [Burkholderiales bacterium]|nr:AMP-binding protein [Burkholderiales bacterium]
MALLTDFRQPHLLARRPFIEQWRKAGIHGDWTLLDLIRKGMDAHAGTRLVFSYNDKVEEVTAGELWRQAGILAAGLARRGLRAGDTVVAQMPNCAEGFVVFLACLWLGLVFVPVVHIYGGTELGFILRRARAKALVVPGRWRKVDYAARVAAAGDLPDLELIVVVGEGEIPRGVHWSEVMAEKTPPEFHRGQPDDICMLNFTSGTTSEPKGVMHSNASLSAMSLHTPPFNFDFRLGPSFRGGPAGHIGVVMIMPRPFLYGDEYIHMDQFEAGAALELIDRYKAVRSAGVPTHMNALIEKGNGQVPKSMQWALLGAQSVPPELIERLDKMGMRAFRSYGCTEHPCMTSGEPDDPLDKRANTDGRVVEYSTARLVDDEGREVPVGEPGEILSMGSQLFTAYLNPEHNQDAFTADGFYRTGDIGVVDKEGFLAIVDRKKDIVVRGGENISSREVEDLLARHPAVLEAAVVGWPDARLGESVGAFVVLREGRSINMEEVQKHFSTLGVARQKTPEHLVVVPEFTRTGAGKVIKGELRKMAKDAHKKEKQGA